MARYMHASCINQLYEQGEKLHEVVETGARLGMYIFINAFGTAYLIVTYHFWWYLCVFLPSKLFRVRFYMYEPVNFKSHEKNVHVEQMDFISPMSRKHNSKAIMHSGSMERAAA